MNTKLLLIALALSAFMAGIATGFMLATKQPGRTLIKQEMLDRIHEHELEDCWDDLADKTVELADCFDDLLTCEAE
jgi:hypothetical protein